MKNEVSRKQNLIYDTIVIGAGAAGLFYAAADNSTGRKLILEKTDRPGLKLLMSGNGMCNITHGGSIKDFINHYGDKGSKIRGCLYKYNNLHLMNFFQSGGVTLLERDDGKVFPRSLKARDILDYLISKAKDGGYDLWSDAQATGITFDESNCNIITLRINGQTEVCTRKLVIATGGASYPSTGSDGSFNSVLRDDLQLQTVPLRPALAPIFVENYSYGGLSGISFDRAIVASGKHKIEGPLLLTHKGFSGPAALHLSQHIKPGDKLQINFLPAYNVETLHQKLKEDQRGNNKSLVNYLSHTYDLPKAFAETLIRNLKIKGASLSSTTKVTDLSSKNLRTISEEFTSKTFSVSGVGGWNSAMVTAGGVALNEVNLKDMSLKKYPNIKVIGEALDINGDTGGYNLQFAYSSANAAL